MYKLRYFVFVFLVLNLGGCGGKYIDDKHNFERAFHAKCPGDIKIVHSTYIQTMHFTEEHEYYFQINPSADSDILKWLTGGPQIVESTDELAQVPSYLNLRSDRPDWFAPDDLKNYGIWHASNSAYIVLRDKRKPEIFVYGSVGM